MQQLCAAEQPGPPLQVGTHAPITHLSPFGQKTPQPPQLAGSLVVSTQPEGQHLFVPEQAGPPLHATAQVPFTQFWPVGQTLPQPPQLFVSVLRSAQPVM